MPAVEYSSLKNAAPRSQQLREQAPFALHAVAFEVEMEVRASSNELLKELRLRLPYSSEPVAKVPCTPEEARVYTVLGPYECHGFRLYVDGHKVAGDTDGERILNRFAGAAMLHVAEHAPGFVFVHAGVVVVRGRAVIFPGRSLSGKSTLTAGLVRAGASYYSDEYALLDPAGYVHAFARDLQMRKPGWREQTSVAVEQFGGVAGSVPVRIGSVCLTRYRAGCTWRPQTIPRGQGVLHTLRHAVAMRRSPSRVLGTLMGGMAEATVYYSMRGETEGTVAAMLAQL